MNREQLDRQIEEYCEQNHIFGMIRVTVKDQIQYEKSVGWADREQQIPFTKDAMFTLYSLSKPFCALGLLILKDRGLVDIDAHPGKYLPEASGFDERVTLRHMMHHISGLPNVKIYTDFEEKYTPKCTEKVREYMKLLAEYPSHFAPGTGAMYNNTNFFVCACIIENLTGMSYADYMQKEVFEPLGMKTAVVDRPEKVIVGRVQGYDLEEGQMVPVAKNYTWMLGAGDIVGTLDDVYCLNKAIKHQLLIKPETWKEVLTPSPLNNMGLGCTVTSWHDKRRITHNGGHTGFRTLHIQLPEDDFDIIFLSNSGFGDARNAIAEMIHDAFYGKDNIQDEVIAMDTGYAVK